MVRMSAPAALKSLMYLSGCAIIRCTSKGFLATLFICFTIGSPNEILGTYIPSITSRWNQSASLSLTILISFSRLRKFAERIDGDTNFAMMSVFSQKNKKKGKLVPLFCFYCKYFIIQDTF